jgi:flagellar hook assembly protein FlgD
LIYGLEQNYPNPFNPSTSISFSLEEYSEVELTIYNMNGQKVKDLEVVRTGLNGTALWDGTNESQIPVSSGVYFYKLTTDNKVYQKKMLMVK